MKNRVSTGDRFLLPMLNGPTHWAKTSANVKCVWGKMSSTEQIQICAWPGIQRSNHPEVVPCSLGRKPCWKSLLLRFPRGLPSQTLRIFSFCFLKSCEFYVGPKMNQSWALLSEQVTIYSSSERDWSKTVGTPDWVCWTFDFINLYDLKAIWVSGDVINHTSGHLWKHLVRLTGPGLSVPGNKDQKTNHGETQQLHPKKTLHNNSPSISW